MSEMVDNPPHYKKHPSGVECIEITEWMNFNLGNAVKYIWRCNEKGSQIVDLEKARWYLDREIKRLEKNSPNGKVTPLTKVEFEKHVGFIRQQLYGGF